MRLAHRIAGAARWRLRNLTSLREAVVLAIVRELPGPAGQRVRFRYYKSRLGALGEGTRIDDGVRITGAEHIFIGRGCWLAAGSQISAGPPFTEGRSIRRRENADFEHREGELHIGDYVLLAAGVLINAHGGVQLGEGVGIASGTKVLSQSAHYKAEKGQRAPAPGRERRAGPVEDAVELGPIVIHDNSVVGANAVLFPGLSMGPGTWLAPCSLARGRLEADKVYRSVGIAEPAS